VAEVLAVAYSAEGSLLFAVLQLSTPYSEP
jgi:hypothetical protein